MKTCQHIGQFGAPEYQLFYLDVNGDVLVPGGMVNPQNKEIYHEMIQEAGEYGPVFLVKHGRDDEEDNWALIIWEEYGCLPRKIVVKYSTPMRFQSYEAIENDPNNYLEWEKNIKDWYQSVKA